MLGDLDKLIVAKVFKNLPKNRQIWSHWLYSALNNFFVFAKWAPILKTSRKTVNMFLESFYKSAPGHLDA